MKKFIFKIIRCIGIIDAVMLIISTILYFFDIINLAPILPILLAILVFVATTKDIMEKNI